MAVRSWLFVPGDSEKKLDKVGGTAADVVILDLEDSVGPDSKGRARDMVGSWLAAHRARVTDGKRMGRWVRINALDSHCWREDLVAVLPGAPDGIMLPKSAGPESVTLLNAELWELEQRAGLPSGSVKIMPLVSETAAAAISIPSYATASLPRLAGLTWGAEDLSAAIGASRKRGPDGGWSDTFRFARVQTLLTAHARGVMAIDTLHADFSDEAGLRRAADNSRADGFAGMLAIHPAQVPVINAAFTPSEDELAEAQAIVEAFAATPDAGTLQIDGRMIDRPHLVLARRIMGFEA